MSEDYELRTFDPHSREWRRELEAWQDRRADKDRACAPSVERLKPGAANAADERRIRDCFAMDAPPGIVAPPLPPFRLLLAAADALPPGATKAQLFYTATWPAVPDRPDGGDREAVRRLRALIPLLRGGTRAEAAGWLDTVAVDLIEGRPDDAVARVARGLAHPPPATVAPFENPATWAQGLIGDLLRARDLDRAVAVTGLLAPSPDCAALDDGLTSVVALVLPMQDDGVVATYMARLQASGMVAQLCPNGFAGQFAADAWLKAGDDVRALDAASRTNAPLLVARTRLSMVERRLGSGDVDGARSLLRTAATALPAPDAGTEFDRAPAARERVRAIRLLARTGDAAAAERIASAFPGPGWRGFAYSVIAASTGKARAGSDGDAPSLDLQEVAAEH